MKIVRSYVEGIDRPLRVSAAKTAAEVHTVKSAHERTMRNFYGDGTELHHEVVDPPAFPVRVGMTVDEVEQTIIEQTVIACGGCITAAAAILGRSRRCVYSKVTQYQAVA